MMMTPTRPSSSWLSVVGYLIGTAGIAGSLVAAVLAVVAGIAGGCLGLRSGGRRLTCST
jgi:hypothetical protein